MKSTQTRFSSFLTIVSFQMIWFFLPVLFSCSMPFVSYYVRSKQFIKSSPSFFRYLDPAFIEWTNQLIHGGFLDDKRWLLQFPCHLLGCGPQVKSMSDDTVILAQLTELTPAHAFAYTLTRRLAEATVQLCACWLPVFLVAAAVYSWRKWQIACKKREFFQKSSKDANQSFYNLKRMYLMLSVVPLSILMPCLAELVFGGILDYQRQLIRGNIVRSSSFSIMSLQVKDMLSESELPSFLHLFNVFRLYRSLYGDIKQSPEATILCQQTELSSSYWSVLTFVGAVYAVIALALRAFVWRPAKKLCSLMTKDNLTPIDSLKEYTEKIPFLAEEVDIFKQRSDIVLQPRKAFNITRSSTNLDVKNKPYQLSDKLLQHFDTYSYPDPTYLFSYKDSQTSSSAASKKSKKRHRRPPESIRDYPLGQRSAIDRKLPIRPRYVSRGTFANLDSDPSTPPIH